MADITQINNSMRTASTNAYATAEQTRIESNKQMLNSTLDATSQLFKSAHEASLNKAKETYADDFQQAMNSGIFFHKNMDPSDTVQCASEEEVRQNMEEWKKQWLDKNGKWYNKGSLDSWTSSYNRQQATENSVFITQNRMGVISQHINESDAKYRNATSSDEETDNMFNIVLSNLYENPELTNDEYVLSAIDSIMELEGDVNASAQVRLLKMELGQYVNRRLANMDSTYALAQMESVKRENAISFATLGAIEVDFDSQVLEGDMDRSVWINSTVDGLRKNGIMMSDGTTINFSLGSDIESQIRSNLATQTDMRETAWETKQKVAFRDSTIKAIYESGNIDELLKVKTIDEYADYIVGMSKDESGNPTLSKKYVMDMLSNEKVAIRLKNNMDYNHVFDVAQELIKINSMYADDGDIATKLKEELWKQADEEMERATVSEKEAWVDAQYKEQVTDKAYELRKAIETRELSNPLVTETLKSLGFGSDLASSDDDSTALLAGLTYTRFASKYMLDIVTGDNFADSYTSMAEEVNAEISASVRQELTTKHTSAETKEYMDALAGQYGYGSEVYRTALAQYTSQSVSEYNEQQAKEEKIEMLDVADAMKAMNATEALEYANGFKGTDDDKYIYAFNEYLSIEAKERNQEETRVKNAEEAEALLSAQVLMRGMDADEALDFVNDMLNEGKTAEDADYRWAVMNYLNIKDSEDARKATQEYQDNYANAGEWYNQYIADNVDYSWTDVKEMLTKPESEGGFGLTLSDAWRLAGEINAVEMNRMQIENATEVIGLVSKELDKVHNSAGSLDESVMSIINGNSASPVIKRALTEMYKNGTLGYVLSQSDSLENNPMLEQSLSAYLFTDKANNKYFSNITQANKYKKSLIGGAILNANSTEIIAGYLASDTDPNKSAQAEAILRANCMTKFTSIKASIGRTQAENDKNGISYEDGPTDAQELYSAISQEFFGGKPITDSKGKVLSYEDMANMTEAEFVARYLVDDYVARAKLVGQGFYTDYASGDLDYVTDGTSMKEEFERRTKVMQQRINTETYFNACLNGDCVWGEDYMGIKASSVMTPADKNAHSTNTESFWKACSTMLNPKSTPEAKALAYEEAYANADKETRAILDGLKEKNPQSIMDGILGPDVGYKFEDFVKEALPSTLVDPFSNGELAIIANLCGELFMGELTSACMAEKATMDSGARVPAFDSIRNVVRKAVNEYQYGNATGNGLSMLTSMHQTSKFNSPKMLTEKQSGSDDYSMSSSNYYKQKGANAKAMYDGMIVTDYDRYLWDNYLADGSARSIENTAIENFMTSCQDAIMSQEGVKLPEDKRSLLCDLMSLAVNGYPVSAYDVNLILTDDKYFANAEGMVRDMLAGMQKAGAQESQNYSHVSNFSLYLEGKSMEYTSVRGIYGEDGFLGEVQFGENGHLQTESGSEITFDRNGHAYVEIPSLKNGNNHMVDISIHDGKMRDADVITYVLGNDNVSTPLLIGPATSTAEQLGQKCFNGKTVAQNVFEYNDDAMKVKLSSDGKFSTSTKCFLIPLFQTVAVVTNRTDASVLPKKADGSYDDSVLNTSNGYYKWTTMSLDEIKDKMKHPYYSYLLDYLPNEAREMIGQKPVQLDYMNGVYPANW